jgi:hypothetical protein
VPVAYRVVTSPPDAGRCSAKVDLPHNALVLRPRQTLQRSECLLGDKQTLVVTQVDAYEVTELGYYYLSRVDPVYGAAFDRRVASGHDAGGQAPCTGMSWTQLATAGDSFRTLVDFYARHDCDEYALPPGYQPFKKPGDLPACAPLLALTPEPDPDVVWSSLATGESGGTRMNTAMELRSATDPQADPPVASEPPPPEGQP